MKKMMSFSVGIIPLMWLLCGSVLASEISTFKGSVSGKEGQPIQGVEITLIHESRGEKSIKIKDDGTFQTRLFEMGDYKTNVKAPGFVVYSIKYQTLGLTGTPEEAQQLVLGADQSFPEFKASPEKTYVYDFVLVPASFFEQKAQEEEMGKVQSQILAAEEKINLHAPAEAIPLLEKAIASKSDIAYPHYLLGVAFYDLDDKEKSRPQFENALKIKADIEGAHFYLGKMDYDKGDKNAALKHFEEEIKISPNRPQTLETLGVLYRDLNQKEQSAETFEKLRALRPEDEKVLNELLSLYTALGKEDKVKEIVAAQESRGQQDAGTYYNLGTAYWKEKDYDAAEDAFKKALAKDPALAPAHKALAYCLIQLKKNKEASGHLKNYLELKPDADDKDKIKGILKEIEN